MRQRMKDFSIQGKIYCILILSVLNIAYASIEIYKSIVSTPFSAKTNLTELEFSKIHHLTAYANFFEIAFLITSVIWTLLLFSKKNKQQFTKWIFIQLLFLVLLFIINGTLSVVTPALIGNLTQLFLGPFIFALGAWLYFIFNRFFSRMKRNWTVHD